MAGLPVAGIGTLFYGVLLLGMGATELWRWLRESIRRIGQGRWETLAGASVQPRAPEGQHQRGVAQERQHQVA